MSFAQALYRVATTTAEPLLGLVMRRRLKAGKEVEGRVPERFGRSQAPALPQPLVWMHGASIGETRLLLELAKHLRDERPDLSILFTSQTVTAAQLIDADIETDPRLTGAARHQFAPIDTTAIAKRFLDHWQPSLWILAEGEIWPNLLREARRRAIPTALINARMTQASVKNWAKWPKLSRALFGGFDLMLAGDKQTAEGLTRLAGRTVESPGNLKASLPPPRHDPQEAKSLRANFLNGRACLTAVSTHPGEEALVLDALDMITPRPACIIVPRHPDRGAEIEALLKACKLSCAVRSKQTPPTPDTDVLLADTLGEVGLFASLADTVYLGGGHAPGIGGHNPLEITRLGKAVASGPDMFNFSDTKALLEGKRGFYFVDNASALAFGFPFDPPTDDLIREIEGMAQAPMDATLQGLRPLLPQEAEQ
ncbi:3-deoxy-D-manno-octulosonic acid transferase [Henriciella aquimarina]|uniref:3-deoxy-D-manno-octulosonic acid transferase n=1 Tax=Henriciella aquimarina TaxID=545261 RepID=UPI000A00F521|nr:glycosyltransferase N-terminal domain-containing protein [Henriciella aquimarina]